MRKKIKKILVYLILIILITKCFQIVFFSKIVQTSTDDAEIIVPYKEFNYGDYTKVKLLHSQTRRNRRTAD